MTSSKRSFVKRYWETPDTQLIEKVEFTRLFPYYAYNNEDDINNWSVKRKMYDSKTTTITPLSKEGNLVNIPEIKNWEPALIGLH